MKEAIFQNAQMQNEIPAKFAWYSVDNDVCDSSLGGFSI